MKKQGFALIIASFTLSIISCRKEGCTDENAINYSTEAKKEDGSCVYEDDNNYPAPSTYTFTRNGHSTVDINGQYQRLDMLSEMVEYLKSANVAGVSLDATTLKAMYANDNYTWIDLNTLGMTGSSKQLKNKTAYASYNGSSDIGVQNQFIAYFDSVATISANTTAGQELGTAGQAGVWPNDGKKGPYLMNGKGHEYTQLIEKGLMCAVFMNQMTVNYLAGISNDDNTIIVDSVNGKYYTEMEHHWDEAFGYFTSAVNFPESGTDRFWGEYSNGREALLQSATKIVNAFITGRTAIINRDYVLRDKQVTIINSEMEKVAAGTAIHYLNVAKANMTYNTIRNHVISEAVAFINGLKYGYNAINNQGLSANNIENALNYIGDDFNVVTISGLNNCIDLLASETGLEDVKTQL
jgi:hypothetical protein